MPWAKLDDNFSDHPKVLRCWAEEPRAIGLFTMALAWAMRHGQEGHIPTYWVASKIPDDRERGAVAAALVRAGLWEENGEGWIVHDFLDWNPSNADVEARREADRKRKAERRGSG